MNAMITRLLCALVVLVPLPAAAQSVSPVEFVLGNGLKVVMVEDHTVPSICLAVGYHVGSRNERPGITGISHLFEHMMFNGSRHFKPTEFDHILEGGGGYSNAYTSNDITFYYEEFNSDLLDTVLLLEADRMEWLTLDSANIEQERGIVKEERRVSTDNSVTGKMTEELYAAAYSAHPYQNPVVGWMADLDNITLEDAREYFRIYYAPNNATMFVVGDFDAGTLREKIERGFGGIPAHKKPRPVIDAEPPQSGEKRITVHQEAELPAVMIGYKAVSASSDDMAPLDLLSIILASGQSSLLYERLVYDRQIAADVSADVDEFVDPGLFAIYVQCQPGHTVSEAEDEVYVAIDEVAAGGITEQELQKAKNIAQADYVDQFKTNAGIAGRLGYYEIIYGDYRKSFTVLDRYAAVSLADIRRVASRYLTDMGRTVVILVPGHDDAVPPPSPEETTP